MNGPLVNMDAHRYLEQLIQSYLGAEPSDAVEHLICSRHALRAAGDALSAAGHLSTEESEAILARYDAELTVRGLLRDVTVSFSNATGVGHSADNAGPRPQPVLTTSKAAGHLEQVLRVADPIGAVGGAAVEPLLLEVWDDYLVLHYRVAIGLDRFRDWRESSVWSCVDDRNREHPKTRQGARPTAGGLRGHVEFAGGLGSDTRTLEIAISSLGSSRATVQVAIPD